jgi:hypothetical protein
MPAIASQAALAAAFPPRSRVGARHHVGSVSLVTPCLAPVTTDGGCPLSWRSFGSADCLSANLWTRMMCASDVTPCN